MIEPTNLLFVYGTLLSGFRANRYLEGSRKIGPAVARGILVDVGHPAMVDVGTGPVRGELYEVPNAETWSAIDIYEGVATNLFLRRKIQAELEVSAGGHIFETAWHYEYLPRPLPKHHVLIQSGDWRKYVREIAASR